MDNRQGPADFTFDPSKIHPLHTGGTLITKTIPGPANWTNSYLTASPTLVPKGQFVQPTQPFAFVMQISGANASDLNKNHPLTYDTISGQPVLIVQDATPPLPPPFYQYGITDLDFQTGQSAWVNAPKLPGSTCP